MKRKVALLAAAAVLVGMVCVSAGEGAWRPDRPVTVIVGMGAGGGIDAMARTMAPALAEYLGVSVVVENMPGSSSGIAAEYITKKDPDGLTIFACSSSICAFSTSENSDVTYHDLEVLAMPFTTHNLAVLVNAKSDVKTMDDFIKMIKSGDTTCSTLGVGSVFHMPAAIIASRLGILDQVTFVPYTSGKEVTLAVAKEECEWTTCGIWQESSQAILSGMVRPLALVDSKSFDFKGYGVVPPITDSLPELNDVADVLGGWRGFAVRPDTPDHIKQELTKALKFAIESAPFQKLLTDNGVIDFPILYGKDAQNLYEKSSRIYSWLLYDLGDTPRSPDKLNVPRPE